MKKIKINSVLSNTENETTNIEALADYNEDENKIRYVEEDLDVEITILSNKVIVERKNDDYYLKLEFVEKETIKCNCNVKTIGLDMEIDVYTETLNIEDNIIYINYTLYNDSKSIGSFEYKLMLRE